MNEIKALEAMIQKQQELIESLQAKVDALPKPKAGGYPPPNSAPDISDVEAFRDWFRKWRMPMSESKLRAAIDPLHYDKAGKAVQELVIRGILQPVPAKRYPKKTLKVMAAYYLFGLAPEVKLLEDSTIEAELMRSAHRAKQNNAPASPDSLVYYGRIPAEQVDRARALCQRLIKSGRLVQAASGFVTPAPL